MCVTYPGRVVSLDGVEAIVVTEGRERRANTLAVPETAPGDWVIVAAGSVVARLDATEAEEVRRLVRVADGHEGVDDDAHDR
jgi:hydrogenase assembly chaperone HypC/HupF